MADPQTQSDLDTQVHRLMAAGASDDDIVFYIKNHQQQATPAPQKTVGGFLGNVVSSGGNFLKNTAEGLYDAGKFALENTFDPNARVRTGMQLTDAATHPQRIISAAGQAVKNRYGSMDAIKNTLYTDPVGVVGDVSTLAGGVGLASDAAGLSRLAKGAGVVSDVTNPLRAVTGPAAAVGQGLQSAATSSYERMLKPTRSALSGMNRMGDTLEQRSQNVAKALLNDPNGQISKTGASRFADATDAIQSKVSDLVDQNPEARGSTQHLTDALEGGRSTFENQWAPGGDTSAYDAVAKDALNNPRVTKFKRTATDTSTEHELGLAPADQEVAVTGRELLPRVRAATARDLTQGTYRNLGDKAYGELKGAETEAQKAAARGGRGILNEAIPAVEPMNNDIANRIDLQQVLDDAVFRSGKHDPIGLGERVIFGGGNIGFLPMSLVNRPGIGSPIARGMNTTGSVLQGLPEGALKAALMARLLGGLSQ